MGTRATITFQEDSKTLCTLYWQFDGYIENGRGEELLDFLESIPIGNGIMGCPKIGEYANGIGDLITQYISLYKKDVGNMYMIYPIQNLDEAKENDMLEEYNYIVNYVSDDDCIYCKVYDCNGDEILAREFRR